MSLGDEDDIFSSFANQLLADLQVDDGDAGWLNLDQLESELAQLDASGPGGRFSNIQPTETPSSAASLVLSHAHSSIPQYSAAAAAPGVDAWSLSLQRFTASALEEDFLSADAARKSTSLAAASPGADFSEFKDYDLTATPRLYPTAPPGLPVDPSQQLLSEAASKLVQQEQLPQATSTSTASQQPATSGTESYSRRQKSMNFMELPQPQAFPHTPQNSMLLESSSAAMVAPTPPPSAHPTPAEPRKIHQAAAAANAQSHAPAMPAPVQHAPGQHPPPVAWQQSRMMQAPPHHHHQAQHMMLPATMPRIYCNPHPKAPPISAQQLASKYMTARDISYVVHSMLKALLSAPTDHEADYQYQLLCRTGLSPPIQHAQQPDAYKNKADILEELLSRQKKAQEWSSEKHALGHILKTNALRPRALIAPTVASVSIDHDSSNKQRASLWKARIYCDQAYQAYANVLECWRTAAPGQVPAFTVQVHLERLLKCFGMTSATEVDAAPLALLLKLRKGRVLVARVLEQALVPPVAVRTLLPLLLQTLMATPPPKDDIASDDRLCLALARVLATVPELTTHDLVNSARAVLRHGSLALSSESRMHCVHALLQRGSVSQQTEEWSQVEAEFMQLLGGL